MNNAMVNSTQIVKKETCQKLSDSPELRNQARHMFYSNILMSEICDYLNIAPMELAYYIYGEDGSGLSPLCWLYKKQNRPESSVASYVAVKPYVLKSTEAKLLRKVQASADEMEKDPLPLDINGIDTAIKAIERLDKITRLEEGKATEHIAIEKRTYSLREITEMYNQANVSIKDLSDPDVPSTIETESITLSTTDIKDMNESGSIINNSKAIINSPTNQQSNYSNFSQEQSEVDQPDWEDIARQCAD